MDDRLSDRLSLNVARLRSAAHAAGARPQRPPQHTSPGAAAHVGGVPHRAAGQALRSTTWIGAYRPHGALPDSARARSRRRPPSPCSDGTADAGHGRGHRRRAHRSSRQSVANIRRATQHNILTAELIIGPVLLLAVFFGALMVGRRVGAPIERARQRQIELTADASHELRTPLSVIEAQTSLALERERDTDLVPQRVPGGRRGEQADAAAGRRPPVAGPVRQRRADARRPRPPTSACSPNRRRSGSPRWRRRAG